MRVLQVPPSAGGPIGHAATLTLPDLRAKLIELAAQRFGIDPAALLAGRPFTELYESFDSLALLDLQLSLEKALGIEWDMLQPPWPTDVDTLARALFAQLERGRQVAGGCV